MRGRAVNNKEMHIKVHAYPDAGEDAVIQKESDSFEVFVREPAQDGRANKRIMTLMQQFYTKERGKESVRIRLVSGTRSPHKIFHIDS